MTTTAEHRANSISANVDRIVSWMKQNKPDQKIIRLYRKDFQWLMEDHGEARVKGFVVGKGEIYYEGFTLLPIEV